MGGEGVMVLLISLLFGAFVLFAAGGVYMGITYLREAHILAKIPNTTKNAQQLLHCRGIAYSSFIAAVGVLIFGWTVCSVNWWIFVTLTQILEKVS
jgi:hypothetical protein